jgi:hypothetical protein
MRLADRELILWEPARECRIRISGVMIILM